MSLSRPLQHILQGPLIEEHEFIEDKNFMEENEACNTRAMIWKVRRQDTSWSPIFTKLSDVKRNANMQWGLQIGNHMYEIDADEGKPTFLTVQRLHGEQIWTPDVPQKILGYCILTDTEVKSAALAVQERMKCAPVLEGAYPAVYNNCQRFVTMLVDRISRHENTVLTEGFTIVTEGFTSIKDLTRWLYGHQRTSVPRPYHKKVPHILQVYPKILLGHLKSCSSHPIRFLKLALNPVKTWRLGQDYRAQLVREELLMMQIEMLPKGSLQNALKRGQEEDHVNKDEEGDEDYEDDEGTTGGEEEFYDHVENILWGLMRLSA